jgi:1-acyl-sn-glycerol-3-phosphate acyltransferase
MDFVEVCKVNDCHETYSAIERTALEVSTPPIKEQTDSDYWREVLESNAEQNSRIAGQAAESYARIRPLFLRVFRRIFRLWSGLHAVDVENLPASGPYILAVNHECHLDSLFVACMLPEDVQRKMVVLSKKEHFARWVTRFVARLCHGIPVDRAQISAGALGICFQVLKQGNVLLIHPEGTRSPDGTLQPFRRGVAVLARHAACPVVPVHIEGGHEFWPKHSFFPRRRHPISVTIGPAIDPRTIAAQTIKDFMQQLMASIAALGNERTQ